MDSSNQMNQELLYEDVAYTLVHQPAVREAPPRVPAMLAHLQTVFDKSDADHESVLKKVKSAAAPAFALKVTVHGASNLEPKNTDGTNSPYCTLGIVHGVVGNSKKEDTLYEADLLEKTSEQQKTLDPVWNETFLLDVESVESDLFCLYMWNPHQASVVKQLRRVNSITGARTLGKIMMKSSLKGRPDNVDVFLGRLCLPLKDLPCWPDEASYKLEPRSRRSTVRGVCRVHTAFVVEKQSQRCTGLSRKGVSRLLTYRGLLEVLLDWEARQASSGDQVPVVLGDASRRLVAHLAEQANLSSLQRNLAEWTVRSGAPRGADGGSPLALLRDINAGWEASAAQGLEAELQQSFRDFTAHAMTKLTDLETSFPASQAESLPRLRDLLECLVEVFKLKGGGNPAAPGAGPAIEQALAEGAERWYNEKAALIKSEKEEELNSLTVLCEEINTHLESSPYGQLLTSVVGVNINAARYQALEKLAAADVSRAMRGVSAMDSSVADLIHRLYSAVQALHRLGGQLLDRKALEASALSSFHEWFHAAIHEWLLVCYKKSRLVIAAAVQKDLLKTETASVNYSSSAFDAVSWFTNMRKFWQRLAWPDSQRSIGFAMRIIKDIFGAAQYYVELIEVKLKTQVSPHSNGRQFLISMEVCTAINSVQHVLAALGRVAEQWPLDPAQRVGDGGEEASTTLDEHLCKYDGEVREVADRLFAWITETILSELKKSLNDGSDLEAVAIGTDVAPLSPLKKADGKRGDRSSTSATPPQSPNKTAAMPLLDKLDMNLQTLNENISDEAFITILTALWQNVVDMFTESLLKNMNHTKDYYQKNLNVLEALKQTVIADGHGLPLDSVHSTKYSELERKLNILKCDTKQLISIYLQEMGNKAPESASRQASVTVQCSYSQRRLVLNILNMKNLPPPENPNDPELVYVQVRLCPPHVFPNTPKAKTAPFKQEASLIIDKTMQFDVDERQARDGSSCLLLRVKYKTTLLTDVLGEAVLLVSKVPGVGGDAAPGGQCSLVLWPHNNESDILAVLDRRVAEEASREFLQALGRLENPARSSVRRITQRHASVRKSIRMLKTKAYKQ